MNAGLQQHKQRELRLFVERVERVEELIRQHNADRKAIYAEAASAGFGVNVIREVVRLRKIDKPEREEFEAVLATYLHALGMAEEPPLFRHFGLMTADALTREGALAAFAAVLPEGADIIVRPGAGEAFRLWRDSDGVAHVAGYEETGGPATESGAKSAGEGEAGARAHTARMSRKKAREWGVRSGLNHSAELNPFPVGSVYRTECDQGWNEGAAKADAPSPEPAD